MSTRLELLKRYLNEDPQDSFLRYAIALEHLGDKKHTEAFELLKSLLNDDPDYLPGYYMAGKSAEALDLKAEAIGFYQKGIEVAEMQRDTHTLSELSAALDELED
jgi:tetratricopeptide (TPR) repeat protein